jgi:hypothetical protein
MWIESGTFDEKIGFQQWILQIAAFETFPCCLHEWINYLGTYLPERPFTQIDVWEMTCKKKKSFHMFGREHGDICAAVNLCVPKKMIGRHAYFSLSMMVDHYRKFM